MTNDMNAPVKKVRGTRGQLSRDITRMYDLLPQEKKSNEVIEFYVDPSRYKSLMGKDPIVFDLEGRVAYISVNGEEIKRDDFYGYYKNGRKIPGNDYPRRSIVENIFFCIKTKYGSVLRNRSYATQKVELISKLLAFNIDRKQYYLCLLFKGCTSAP